MTQLPEAAYESDPTVPDGTHAAHTAPSDAAFVVITTTPDGPGLGLSVPDRHSARLLDTVALLFCVLGVVLAPSLTARALSVLETDVPWQTQTGLVALSVLAPLATVAFLRHRHR